MDDNGTDLYMQYEHVWTWYVIKNNTYHSKRIHLQELVIFHPATYKMSSHGQQDRPERVEPLPWSPGAHDSFLNSGASRAVPPCGGLGWPFFWSKFATSKATAQNQVIPQGFQNQGQRSSDITLVSKWMFHHFSKCFFVVVLVWWGV